MALDAGRLNASDMRFYTVQAGDSPARIAVAFAGCPKCAADLVAVNPHKSVRAYPNGFRTFADLRVGEGLWLPDKWFDGTLDRAPQSYFEALPSHTGQQGVGASPVPDPSTPQLAWGQVLTFAPCEAYQLRVWPIQQGLVGSDPVAALQAMGFWVYSRVDSGTDGSTLIGCVFNSQQSVPTDPSAAARRILVDTTVYFKVGDTLTGQTSKVTATITAINPGSFELGPTFPTDAQFTVGETVSVGSGQWAVSATVLYQYAVVLVGTAGVLGVTLAVDLGKSGGPGVLGIIPTPPGGWCSKPQKLPGPGHTLPSPKVTCPWGQVPDTATNACGAPCGNGTAPVNGVCGPCPSGQVTDGVTGICAPTCSNGSPQQAGVCPGAAGCPSGQVADSVTGACSPPCPDGKPRKSGQCAAAPSPTPCAAGTIADTTTGKCVAPCADGSAPAAGVCPTPTPPVTPPATSSSTVTTVAAAAGGLGLLGLLAWAFTSARQ